MGSGSDRINRDQAFLQKAWWADFHHIPLVIKYAFQEKVSGVFSVV